MAASHRIDCIKKTDRRNVHERISHVGGRTNDGTRWRVSQERAITGIKSGEWSFYVHRPPAPRVEVVVATSAQGHEYLKTVADGVEPNNLLALPECPQ